MSRLLRCTFVAFSLWLILQPGLAIMIGIAEKHDHYMSILDEAGERIAQRKIRKMATGADVGAWLHMGHKLQKLSRNMYSPMLVTVQDALEAMGLVTRIVGQASNEEMLAGVRAAVAGGKKPLVVAVAYAFGIPQTTDTLKLCADAGAKLILYNTEPGWSTNVFNDASTLNASEIWDYSKNNIAEYPESTKIAVRLVPPGYSPDFDVGVNLHSPSRMEDHIGFMGNLVFRSSQDRALLAPMIATGALFETHDVWTKEQMQVYLDKYPVQLNLHHVRTRTMEAFRLAPLLSNRACIISAPADSADDAMWQDVLNIVEVSDIPHKLEELRGQVASCQNDFHEKFKSRFQPLKILQDSGFTFP